ncbi:MAG: hypothetical protein Q9194_001236 [Teloschistes cf. exilis]
MPLASSDLLSSTLLPSSLLRLGPNNQSPRPAGRMAPRKHGGAVAHPTEHSPKYYQQMENDLNSTEGAAKITYQALRNLRRRNEKALLTEVKERYKKEQPVIDVQRQLEGLPVAEQEALRAAEYVFAERVQAIDALFTFARSSTEEECQPRVTAINALIGLCKKQESQGFRRRKADIKVKEEQTSVSLPPSRSETLPVECEAT